MSIYSNIFCSAIRYLQRVSTTYNIVHYGVHTSFGYHTFRWPFKKKIWVLKISTNLSYYMQSFRKIDSNLLKKNDSKLTSTRGVWYNANKNPWITVDIYSLILKHFLCLLLNISTIIKYRLENIIFLF